MAGALVVMGESQMASAQKAGHKYVQMDVVYTIQQPGSVYGGQVICNSIGSYTNCYRTPVYASPATTRNVVLSVVVDCTDRTYDAKGDGKGWQSWGADAVIYKLAYERCQVP